MTRAENLQQMIPDLVEPMRACSCPRNGPFIMSSCGSGGSATGHINWSWAQGETIVPSPVITSVIVLTLRAAIWGINCLGREKQSGKASNKKTRE